MLASQRGGFAAHLRVGRQPLCEGVLGCLNSTVMQRAQEQLELSAAASTEAQETSKSLLSNQQQLVAAMAVDDAEKAILPSKPAVPEAEAALTTTRKFAALARQHAVHALEVAAGARHIAQNAAEKAAKAIEEQIRADAYKAAEASAVPPKEAAEVKAKKIAASVAAAAEPYHLAVLRTQKETQQLYEKAKSATNSAQLLRDKAHTQATSAAAMQAKGDTLRAQQLMLVAHSTLGAAENLRQWGLKLYDQANQMNGAIGFYVGSESMAAANAAATTIVNPSMEMPPLPSI